jgi:hypothetical protein
MLFQQFFTILSNFNSSSEKEVTLILHGEVAARAKLYCLKGTEVMQDFDTSRNLDLFDLGAGCSLHPNH